MAVAINDTSSVNGGSGSTVTVPITVSVGDNCVVFCAGGYAGADRLPATATLDGNAMTRLQQIENGGDQHAALFVMYDDDANWPGVGTFDCVATFGGTLQERGAAAALSGVDVGGTPEAGSGTTTGSATTPAITIGSETIDQAYDASVAHAAVAVHLNAASGDALMLMFVNTYSADHSGAGTGDTVEEAANNGGGSSSFCFLSRVVVGAGGGTNLAWRPVGGRPALAGAGGLAG